MNLLMFDVDGTLIHSIEYDRACFMRAVSTTMGFSIVDSDWENYEHVTDSGILDELVRRNYGRRPTEEEIYLVQERFLIELDSAFARHPCLARPIEGAITFFSKIRSTPDIAVSIATGGWEKSCRKKLDNSGILVDGIPLASADDAISRIDIMNASLSKAGNVYQQSDFKSVTYVGDGNWDLKASMVLGWNFIAIGDPILSIVDDRPRFWVRDFSYSQELIGILEDIVEMD